MSSHAEPIPSTAPSHGAPPHHGADPADSEPEDTDETPAPAPPAAPRRPFAFPADARRFLEDARFAVIATINPDGSPHQAVVWYRLDDDSITINSAEGRRWPSNLRRDPRISFFVEDGYRWVSVRGAVDTIEEQTTAQADIASMAYRYHEDVTEAEDLITNRFQKQQRVSFRIHPTSVSADLEEEE